MKFQISVSQHDIDNSQRGYPHGCMVHSAFMRSTDGLFGPENIYVDAEPGVGWYIHVHSDERPVNWLMFLHKLPGMERIDHIIEAWDAGYTVEPFSFWIDLPNEAFQLYLPEPKEVETDVGA